MNTLSPGISTTTLALAGPRRQTCRASARPSCSGRDASRHLHLVLQGFGKLAAVAGLTALLSGAGMPLASVAANDSFTAQLFTRNCAGCHVGGGNILAAGKTLKTDALSANGYDEAGALKGLITMGKDRMPGFGEACAPRGACTFSDRLSEAEIADLAEFVLAQATAGWPATTTQ